MTQHDVGELIVRCVQGDDSAKAEFVITYSECIRRAVLRKLSSLAHGEWTWEEAEDIGHDILVRIFSDDCRALDRLRNPQSIHAWLVTVSQNHVVTFLRKRSVRDRTQRSMLRETPARYGKEAPPDPATSEERDLLNEHLAELPAQDRLILKLYFLHELKYTEIADMLKLNINTVSARLRRAKQKLRKSLEKDFR